MDIFIAFCLGTFFGAFLSVFTLAVIAGVREEL